MEGAVYRLHCTSKHTEAQGWATQLSGREHTTKPRATPPAVSSATLGFRELNTTYVGGEGVILCVWSLARRDRREKSGRRINKKRKYTAGEIDDCVAGLKDPPASPVLGSKMCAPWLMQDVLIKRLGFNCQHPHGGSQ